MPLSLKTRQVAGVTLIVGLAVVGLSIVHLKWVARSSLDASLARGELIARSLLLHAKQVVRPDDPVASLRGDPGIRSILQSGLAFSENVTYVAIVDPSDVAIVHSSPVLENRVQEKEETLDALLLRGSAEQFRAVYSDRTFEVREQLPIGPRNWSIRVGLSMLLVRDEIRRALRTQLATVLAALAIATLGAMLFAQWVLRPIHVVSTGLTRLGRGEFDVKLDLPPGEEFADLGRSFDSVSAELSSVRSRLAGQPAHSESIIERLEDAVAVVSPAGDILFANAAMRGAIGARPDGAPLRRVPDGHPYRRALDPALRTRSSPGPVQVKLALPDAAPVEHLVTASVVQDAKRGFVGVMLVARNLGYLAQVQSTLRYSRKLAALGRLLAGVAHEVKNPLNAMAIHLELLKQKLQGGGGSRKRVPAAASSSGAAESAVASPSVEVGPVLHHANVIGQEIRRLDEVVQGFLKFSRPDEITLQPVSMHTLVDDVVTVVEPEAMAARITVHNECSAGLPPVNGDPAMLKQALLNLALNACQAMPDGGTLRFVGRAAAGGVVEIAVEDTGIGIPAENLGKVFDLYFTTRERGSGIGLSVVYRTVQLHDGNIEVESTPGAGTTFRLVLPQAPVADQAHVLDDAATASR